MPEIIGGGGVKLHVAEAGNPLGVPLLFIHGYCQSLSAWERQLRSDLARDFRLVAFDLRGHGASQKPLEAASYDEARLWADDVAAIVERLDLRRTVLVAWSYGGLVVGDYLRAYGTERLGALALVGAVTLMGDKRARSFAAPSFLELFPAIVSADAAVAEPALSRLVDLCFAPQFELDAGTRAARLSDARKVPAVAREAMQRRRNLDYDDLLRELELPVMCMHGSEDRVILPSSSERTAGVVPNAQLSIYPAAGHALFFEDSTRFNRELAELANRVA